MDAAGTAVAHARGVTLLYYCPQCWRELPAADAVCPICGPVFQFAHKDYDDRLIAALCHPLPGIAAHAAWVLGTRRCQRAVPAMAKLVEESDEPERLTAVAEALGELGGDQATACLQRLTHHGNILVRRSALRSLQRLGRIQR